MFAQDLSSDNKGEFKTIEYLKYSIFNNQYSFLASPAWVLVGGNNIFELFDSQKAISKTPGKIRIFRTGITPRCQN